MSSTSAINTPHSIPLQNVGSVGELLSAEPNEVHVGEQRVNESALPPVDGGPKAWAFLAAAFVLEAIVWGYPMSFGIFLEAYLKDPKYNTQPHAAKLLPLIGPLTTGLLCCAGIVVSPYCSRYPQHRRWILWTGLLLAVGSLLGASWCDSVPGLIFLQGVTYALGGAFLYLPGTVLLSEWFVEKRGMASGVIFAGTGVGGIFLPLIFSPLIARYGSRNTLRGYAICMGLMIAPLLPFLKGRLPISSVRGPLARSSGNRRAWKNSSIWTLLTLNTLQGFAYCAPLIWLPTFANELTLNPTKSALTLTLLNGSSVVGRLGLGYLSDIVNPWTLAIFQLLTTSILTFVLWGIFSYKFAGLLVFSIAYGAIGGGWTSLWSGFVRRIAKDDLHLTNSIFGLLLLTRGIADISSTPISTSILSSRDDDRTWTLGFNVGGGRYENLILYVGGCFAGASAFAAGAWAVERRLKRAEHMP
ncbi:MFS general substrate transporter [Flagelloscypha sp. PMI_526]|nr:MFS general substrate transporter [Flagelloscypha sp. PMI_526]